MPCLELAVHGRGEKESAVFREPLDTRDAFDVPEVPTGAGPFSPSPLYFGNEAGGVAWSPAPVGRVYFWTLF